MNEGRSQVGLGAQARRLEVEVEVHPCPGAGDLAGGLQVVIW